MWYARLSVLQIVYGLILTIYWNGYSYPHFMNEETKLTEPVTGVTEIWSQHLTLPDSSLVLSTTVILEEKHTFVLKHALREDANSGMKDGLE